MKIALCEWFPRVCGSTEWGFHLAAGATKSTQVDLVTFSKSGRPLKGFYRPERWTVHRYADAVDALNQYDLVIGIDLVCFAPQLSGRKFFQSENFAPYYVELLEKIRTPWTAMYHGGLYSKKYDGVLTRLLHSKKFCGTLITTRLPQAKERLEHLLRPRRKISFINDPFLPFRPNEMLNGEMSHWKRERSMIITSRIAVNKGQNVMLGLLPQLAGDVHVWGYNAFGLPSIGWRLWELGNALDYRVAKKVQLRRDARSLTHPRAARFYTGAFAFESKGRRYEYHDGYDTHDDVDWSPWLHLSFTSTDFEGSLEYVTLNAVVAGCVGVVPEHALRYTRGEYDGAVPTVPFERCTWWAATDAKTGPTPRGTGKKGKFVGREEAVVASLNALLEYSDDDMNKLRRKQLACIERLHDPKRVLGKLVKGVSR